MNDNWKYFETLEECKEWSASQVGAVNKFVDMIEDAQSTIDLMVEKGSANPIIYMLP